MGVFRNRRAGDRDRGASNQRSEAWRLTLVLGTLAFIQGINEPGDGLVSQPLRTLLRRQGWTSGETIGFSALVSLPWIVKPLFGLATDFVPLAGTRRKGYLVASSALITVVFLGIFLSPLPSRAGSSLVGWLTLATAAVALNDVAADALMVERGQVLGLTGRLQAVQWGSLYASGIGVGFLGGWLAQTSKERWAFLICGAGGAVSLLVSWGSVREPVRKAPAAGLRDVWRQLAGAGSLTGLLGIGAFLFLWNFNPFSNAVLHLHMTEALGLGEQFFGNMTSLSCLAAIVASFVYGAICRAIALPVLVRASIVLGVASTLAYLVMFDARTAVLATVVSGFAYMIATLIQLDLAAQRCPPELAGTLFALLLSLENLAVVLSTWLGGKLYEAGNSLWDPQRSFRMLVIVGSTLTACCWLLLPALNLAPGSKPGGKSSPEGPALDE